MSLLEMSAAGGVMILAVIVVRALALERLPKVTFTALWAVAVARLLVPVSVPSSVSAYGWLTDCLAAESVAPEEDAVPAVFALLEGGTDLAPAADREDTAEERAGDGVPTGRPGLPWGTILWAAGCVSCGGYFALSYLTACRRFREAVAVEDGFVARWQAGQRLRRRVSVRLSGRVRTPMTYGLIRPVVLLPASTDWRDRGRLELILAHEYAHIRRLDGLKKLLLAAAVCLHWFNPLVWAMFFLANRDMEMACDEQVVRRVRGDKRAAYARTLIDMEQAKGVTPLVSCFAASAMEERITAIMKMKKLTAAAVAVSLVLTLGVTAVFATGAPAETGPAAAESGEPVPYDWGGVQVYVPVTEETLRTCFAGEDIRWWTAEEYAAWMEEQRSALARSVGAQTSSGSSGLLDWTEEGTGAVMAAYEQTLAAIQDGMLLSRNVNGDGTVVIAVRADAPAGGILDAQDAEAMMYALGEGYAPEDVLGLATDAQVSTALDMPDGGVLRVRGSVSWCGALKTAKAILEERVAAGAMDAEASDGVLEELWSRFQKGELPQDWRTGGPADRTG